MSFDLFVASPIYRGVEPTAAASFAALFAGLGSRGMIDLACPWATVGGDSNQPRARNVLFRAFLQSGARLMLCVDPDQILNVDTVLTLMEARKDVIVPFINRRRLEESPVGRPLGSSEIEIDGSITEMERIGFGVVLLSRECVLRMAEERIAAGAVFDFHGMLVPEIVSQVVQNGEWLAVDDVFSMRWRAIGGRMWLHQGARSGHLGTHVF